MYGIRHGENRPSIEQFLTTVLLLVKTDETLCRLVHLVSSAFVYRYESGPGDVRRCRDIFPSTARLVLWQVPYSTNLNHLYYTLKTICQQRVCVVFRILSGATQGVLNALHCIRSLEAHAPETELDFVIFFVLNVGVDRRRVWKSQLVVSHTGYYCKWSSRDYLNCLSSANSMLRSTSNTAFEHSETFDNLIVTDDDGLCLAGSGGQASDRLSLSAEDLVMAMHKASSRRIEVLSRTTGNVDQVCRFFYVLLCREGV